MMFLVVNEFNYEPSDIVGLFQTVEEATEFAKKYREADAHFDGWMRVYEIQPGVEFDQFSANRFDV